MSTASNFHVLTGLLEVMESIGHVSKDGKNNHQKYKFRSIDDVMGALQPALIKAKIVMAINCSEPVHVPTGGKGFNTHLMAQFTFRSAVDGSSHQCSFPGTGWDSGDKGVYKALAGAFKYAITQTFSIPTEEPKDAENDSPEITRADPSEVLKWEKNLSLVKTTAQFGKAQTAFEKLSPELQNALYTALSQAKDRSE